MSEILWCDLGNHQFSANDPDRTVQVEDLSYVQKQEGARAKRYDMCGPCKAGINVQGDPVKNFFDNMINPRKAIPTSKRPRTPAERDARIAELEKELGVNQ